ncbi:FG-GAP-like repeat-containing protein [Streptomyces sp. NPDC054975]
MRTSWRRRLTTAATALGLTSLGLLGASTPAQAAISDCPKGYFCAWETTWGTGAMFKTNVSKATLGSWDNKFDAVVNHTSKYACLYDEPNYSNAGGTSIWEPDPAGTEWGYASWKAVSSVKLVPTKRECYQSAYPEWYSAVAPTAAGFGDMNGDRRADVLVRDEAGRLWFLPGDLSGRMVGTGGWNAMNALVRHGDFSGDGREDVIAREASTGTLWLYPGTGSGALGTRKLLGSGGWNGMTRLTAFGDLSGDGRSDVVAVEKSTGKLWLYPGTSSGGLGARKLLGSGGWNAMNALVGAGDMNKDGVSDLVVREASTGKLWLYPGRTGSFGPRELMGSGGWNGMTTILAVGDYGADGAPDLAAVTNSAFVSAECRGVGCMVLYPGTGTGRLGQSQPQGWDWAHLNGVF